MKNQEFVKIIFKNKRTCKFSSLNGTILSIKENLDGYSLNFENEGGNGSYHGIITVESQDYGFTFKPLDVRKESPIFSSRLEVAITTLDDKRNYNDIYNEIKIANLFTDVEKAENSSEFSYAKACKASWHRCPTFLGVFGNVNLWEAGFRGFPIEEKQHFDLYDYFVPRKNWDKVSFGDDAQNVVYRYMLGRGMGYNTDLKRQNYKGYLPSLIATLRENGIEYKMQAFADSLEKDVNDDGGTYFLTADRHSAGNVLRPEQIENSQDEGKDTLLRVRIEMKNVGKTSSYAYLRLPEINTPVMSESNKVNQSFCDGVGRYGDKIYMLSFAGKTPLNSIESAFLIPPQEKKVVELLLFSSPVGNKTAKGYKAKDFKKRLAVLEKYWTDKAGSLLEWKFPEKCVEDAFKTGYFHIMQSCFGLKDSDTFAPSVGVYSPIGSESSPVIRFLDAIDKGEFAGKCLNFFFDKQREDGFIQNQRGYMLENGATLFTAGAHYSLTKDKKWLERNKIAIKKATNYIISCIDRNKNDKPFGYGMIDGQVADPEDTFRSFTLNALAYAGLIESSKMLTCAGLDGETPLVYAKELKQNVQKAYKECMVRAPLVPLKNGEWTPAVGPWAESRSAISLHSEGEICVTHAAHNLKDSLLSLPFLAYYGVLEENSVEFNEMVDYITDTFYSENVAYSQPYYNLLPFVNLYKGKKNAFLSEFYGSFATLSDRETYSFWEHYFLATPHKTHEQAWFLMRVKDMLFFEKDDKLNLLWGVPDKWRKKGNRIFIKDAKCSFGKFDLEVVFGDSVSVFINSDFDCQCRIKGSQRGIENVKIYKGTNSFVFDL